MANRIQNLVKQIVKQFQRNFSLLSLFRVCIQIYEKQSKHIKKKFINLSSRLLLNNARSVEYKKKKQLLESWLPSLKNKEIDLNKQVSNSQAQELMKILDLLAEWKQSIELCFTFLNQVSSQSWAFMKNQMLKHINRHYKTIQSLLSLYFQRVKSIKKVNEIFFAQKSRLKQNMFLFYNDQCQLSYNWRWKEKALIDNQNFINEQQRQHQKMKKKHDFLKRGSGHGKPFQCKFYTQGDEITNQVSKQKYIFRNSKNLSDNQFQTKAKQQDPKCRINKENMTKQEQVQFNDKMLIKGDNNNGLCSVQANVNEQKSAGVRHKSTIVSLNGFRRANGLKHNYSSFKKLQVSNNLSNQNQANSEVTSSKSKHLMRQSKIKNNASESKNSRNSKKSLNNLQQCKKGRENKSKDMNFTKQQLKQIEQSFQTLQKQQNIKKTQKQQGIIIVQMNQQSFQKDKTLNDFYSTNTFKEPKNRRRMAINNKIMNSLHAINRPDYFKQIDLHRQSFSKKSKITKNGNRTSLFRSSGLTQERKSSPKPKNSKNNGKRLRNSYFLKKDVPQDVEVSDIFAVQENKTLKRKGLSRFNTQFQETYTKYDPVAKQKDMYRILTEINQHQRNEHSVKYDEYYDQLLKRKYANVGRVYDYGDYSQFKPTTFKIESCVQEQKSSNWGRKVDSLLIDFMKVNIKTNQLLVLEQIGISSPEESV